MAFTPQEQKIILYGKTNGKTKEQVKEAILKYRSGYRPPAKETEPVETEIDTSGQPSQLMEATGIPTVKRIGEGLKERVENVKESFARQESFPGAGDGQTALETGLQTAGQVVGAVTDVAAGVAGGVFRTALSPQTRAKILGNPTIQEGLQLAGEGMEVYEAWKAKNPRLAGDLEAVVNIGSIIPVGKGAQLGVRGVKGAVRAGEAVVEGGAKLARTGLETAERAVQAGKGATGLIEEGASFVGRGLKRGQEAISETLEQTARRRALPKPEADAVRTGIDENITTFVKESKPDDIKAYKEMTQIAKESTNMRSTKQAKEVAGRTIAEKAVAPAIKIRDEVGAQIGEIAKKLSRKAQDISALKDEFARELRKVGVRITKDGELIAGKTAVEGDLSAYKNMWSRIKSGKASLKDLHDIRSATFKEFDLAKARQQAFSSQADTVAEKFRSILARPISSVDKTYIPLSTKYGKTMKALGDFMRYVDPKANVNTITAKNLRIAETMSRVLGNASARPQEIMDAIIAIADDAGKGVSQSIRDQIRFADLLENFYGTSQTKSMTGQVARGVKAGVEDVATDVVTGGPISAGAKFVKGILGTSPKDQQKALEAFLESLSRE